ncbi:MAG TPA: hypothetical protein GXX14_02610 [Clostridiaceae bacterium]|nr:hypothetical protein [Clostridiaceae bacterium]
MRRRLLCMLLCMFIVINIVPWQAVAEEPGQAITEAFEPASQETYEPAIAESPTQAFAEASEPAYAEAPETVISEAPETASEVKQNNNPFFNDVSPNDWFYDAIMYAVKNNIFSGTGNNNFSPYSPMTRAMYVTVLGRIAGIGSDYPVQEGLFSDVKPNAYYAPYVMWAVEKGIARGTGNNRFSPDSLLTRGQMAVFTVRFFDAYGIALPGSAPKKLLQILTRLRIMPGMQ